MNAENIAIDQQQTPVGSHRINLLIGIVGMIIVICGNLITDLTIQKSCYLSGGILMLISSALERQLFFVVLQCIITTGALVAFAPFAPVIKAAVPISLSIIAIIYFAKQKMLQDRLAILGCAGLILLAAGYAITHPVIYLLGSLGLTVYSLGAYRKGITIGLLWGILNAIFAITAGVAVYRLFVH